MKTLIVGSGPAGLNCALHAASPSNQVIIIEKNEKAGKKLFITGKGRCNVTNDCSQEDFIHHVVSNPRFLYSAISAFGTNDTIRFFEDHRCPLVIERGKRVFPASYHAYDITNTLVHECIRSNVDIHLNETVLSIQKKDSLFLVTTNKEQYEVDNVVLATGGLAYPATGSTGDGYRFAEVFSHHVIEPVPALCGLRVNEEFPSSLIGFTLKNVSLTAKVRKWKKEEFGELTFGKDYLDGPIVLTISSLINRKPINDVVLELDFKAALDENQLRDRLQRDIDQNPKNDVYSLLKGLLPSELLPYFIKKAQIDPHEKCATFSSGKRANLIHYLKHMPFVYVGLNPFEKAIVTSGGVSVKEIDASTMQSKLVPGLYFAGEVIDCDAFTGGFNIQIALSTGALAGDSIKKLDQ